VIFSGDLRPGQQVRTVRDVKDWAGSTAVKRGKRGIVRKTERGFLFFQTSYVVEFGDGLMTRRVRVRASDIRGRLFDGGEAGWRARHDWEVGIRLGLFCVFGLPALWAVVHYLVFDGGSVEELVAALPMAVLGAIVDLLQVVGPAGALLIGLVLWLRTRLRS
jgi:hypothetical protein